MQIYFHSRLCSYLSRVPILVEGTVAQAVALTHLVFSFISLIFNIFFFKYAYFLFIYLPP